MSVRVRYAPSPTGEPHVGNIRTALFNWLFARHHGGVFIVRIEDTDVARTIPGALEATLDSLRWLGLDWDEGPEVGGPYGPYVQSQRAAIYQEVAHRLVQEGHAYYCYCSPERLEEMRAAQMRHKEPPRYDRRCRDLSPQERQRSEDEGIVPVVRLKLPLSGQTVVHDLIREEVVFDNSLLDDLVLLKSDSYPTYHLANVVDDHLMQITHVLRAEEWLPSTPRHLVLYEALGWSPPQFAHLPMILGPDRAKLSKRHGATSITAYKEMGYLPEAMVNFLALLGWSLDDHTELISPEDLVRHFDIPRVTKAAAIFNTEKLNWMNGVYIRQLSVPELTQRLRPFLEGDLPTEVPRPLDGAYVERIVPLIQDRLKTLGEAAGVVDLFFLDLEYEPQLLLGKHLTSQTAAQGLEAALASLSTASFWEPPALAQLSPGQRYPAAPPWGPAVALEDILRPLAAELGLKTGDFFMLLRVAVSGRTVSPPLFETMAVLGRERCLRRLVAAQDKLHALV